MPPKKAPKQTNKKKKSTRNRSEKAVCCAECGIPIADDKKGTILCQCTQVRFCGEICQQKRRNHQCTGVPEQVHTLSQMLQRTRDNNDNPISCNPENQRRHKQEMREMNQSIQQALLAECLLSDRPFNQRLDDLTVDVYKKHADMGNAACAYMAGIHFKNRLLGNIQIDGNDFVADARGYDVPDVLTSDDLAFRYFKQASKAGIPLAMQSLADMYEHGRGCRQNMHLAREWLWRAVQHKSAGAYEIFDTKIVLKRELMANLDMFDSVFQRQIPGQGFNPSGPNIASLFVVLLQTLSKLDYSLPAFAAVVPSCQVTGQVRQTAAKPVQIPSKDELNQISSHFNLLKCYGVNVHPSYGRRGVARSATALTLTDAVRSLDNMLFVIPPYPACDDSSVDVEEWISRARSVHSYNTRCLPCECSHTEAETDQNNNSKQSYCRPCIKDAVERLRATAAHSTVFSIDELLQGRGRWVIWRRSDGSTKYETFKNYGRGEVECALAALVACRNDYETPICDPLFVAQDPNLYWPLIQEHGTIRAALEHVAPHIDWVEELGPVHDPVDPIPIIGDYEGNMKPGLFLRKCGNDMCLILEPESSPKKLSPCSRCQRRFYCSHACQRMDNRFHKRECKAGGKPVAEPANIQHELRTDIQGLSQGEEIVLHGLVARPELNGRVGLISGNVQTSGRYPVQIFGINQRPIAVKTSNILRLCVQVNRKEKRSPKYECLHGLSTCSDCFLDFVIVNQLSRLRQRGQDIDESSTYVVAENHFASIEHPGDCEQSVQPGVYFEAWGIRNEIKQKLLNYLLGSESASEIVIAAVTGMVSFSARERLAIRASAAFYCYQLVRTWNGDIVTIKSKYSMPNPVPH